MKRGCITAPLQLLFIAATLATLRCKQRRKQLNPHPCTVKDLPSSKHQTALQEASQRQGPCPIALAKPAFCRWCSRLGSYAHAFMSVAVWLRGCTPPVNDPADLPKLPAPGAPQQLTVSLVTTHSVCLPLMQQCHLEWVCCGHQHRLYLVGKRRSPTPTSAAVKATAKRKATGDANTASKRQRSVTPMSQVGPHFLLMAHGKKENTTLVSVFRREA